MNQEFSQNIDQTKFNIGVDITMRISLWLRRSDEYYVMRNPEQMKLSLDNVYRMIALYLKDMPIGFQQEFSRLKKLIDS